MKTILSLLLIFTLTGFINAQTSTHVQSACDHYTWIDGNTYTANNNTATHTIIGGAANGNDSIITLNLTISDLITNSTYTDNGNGNYSFTNTSTGNYTQTHWAFGDGNTSTTTNSNHNFSANGTFIVTLTVNDSNTSCMDYYLDTINVTGVTNPLQCNSGFVMYPAPPTSIEDITIINSSTGSNLTYLWDFGNGDTSIAQNPNHNYSTSGPFYLCLTIDDGNGCIDMYCDSIGENGVVFNKAGGFTINVISAPLSTGIDNNIESNSEVAIYPNPASNQLTINTELKLSEITIIDITGKIIMTIKQNTNIINVSDLSDGIYFIQLITEDRRITKKFVKQ